MRPHGWGMRRLWLLVASALWVPSCLAEDYSGKVLSPDGNPVAGATVYLAQSDAANLPRQMPTTRSDGDGQFHFTVSGTGSAECIAVADGFGAAAASIDSALPADIHLLPRTDLTLTLRTMDDKPATGVTIRLQNVNFPQTMSAASNLWIPRQYQSPWTATTDGVGTCVLAGLPQGGWANLAVVDERFANFSYQEAIPLANDPQTKADTLHLIPGATISGKITFATTRPAAGIHVGAQSSDLWGEAITAADGSYVIKQLRPGTYNVEIDLDPTLQESWTAKANEGVSISMGTAKSGVDFALVPGVVLSGKVVADDDGKPAANVSLGIYGPAHPRTGGWVQAVTTDANGAFAVRVLPGEQYVYVSDPTQDFSQPNPPDQTLTVADGTAATVEFRLPRSHAAPITGKVLDPDGTPVAGAIVYASSDVLPLYNAKNNTVLSDAQGNFQTQPMQRLGQIELRAMSGDMATPAAVAVEGDGNDVILHLRKNALAAITGVVIDPQGNPLKGAQVTLDVRIDKDSFSKSIGVTDDDGNYKIGSLWPDAQYSVEATCPGYGTASGADIQLNPGQWTSAPDLTLFKLDSTIAGVLLDDANKPAAGRQIFVRGSKTGIRNMTTDADGKFETSVVGGDSLRVYFSAGHGQSSQAVESSDRDIILQMNPASPPPVEVTSPEPAAAPIEASPSSWGGWTYAAAALVLAGAATLTVNIISILRRRKRLDEQEEASEDVAEV